MLIATSTWVMGVNHCAPPPTREKMTTRCCNGVAMAIRLAKMMPTLAIDHPGPAKAINTKQRALAKTITNATSIKLSRDRITTTNALTTFVVDDARPPHITPLLSTMDLLRVFPAPVMPLSFVMLIVLPLTRMMSVAMSIL